MQIQTLELQRFRCFEQQKVDFQPGLNLLYGDNGSGKTSVLEALSLLFHKRSFRTTRTTQAIADQQDNALIQAQLEQAGKPHRVAMQISKNMQQHVVNQEHSVSRAALQRAFPMFIMDPASASALIQEPESRRRWADRALFHVKPEFIQVWQHFHRSLRQRNAALARGGAELKAWTEQFVQFALSLDMHRAELTATLLPRVHELLSGVAGSLLPPLSLEYRRGWKVDCDLGDELLRTAATEKKMGFTMVGPHRADLVIRTEQGLARERLSRGQIKVLALCLNLAQLQYAVQGAAQAVFLWDDWLSELAPPTQRAALRALQNMQLQVVLTAPGQHWPDDLPEPGGMFHVKH